MPRAAGASGENFFPLPRSRKFSALLSVNLRICEIYKKKKITMKAIVCFIQQKRFNPIVEDYSLSPWEMLLPSNLKKNKTKKPTLYS